MKKTPWYQNLQIIAWSAGGLTAAGALIVGTARYINLPREVEAAQQKNVQQDDALNKLSTIAEQNQKLLDRWDGIYQQQQRTPNQLSRPQVSQPVPQTIPNLPVPPQTPIRVQWEQDAYGNWFCRSRTGDWWWPNEQGDCE